MERVAVGPVPLVDEIARLREELERVRRAVRTCATMREAQQIYFRSRCRRDLDIAKDWERRADRAIAEVSDAG